MSTLDVLIKKLAGANSTSSEAEAVVEEAVVSDSITDPVFVEKLASAVDFIVDNFAEEQEESHAKQEEVVKVAEEAAQTEKPTDVSQISAILKNRLQQRFEEKTAEKNDAVEEGNTQLAKDILGKLLVLKSNKSEPVETPVKEASTEEAPLEQVFEQDGYNEESEDVSNETPEEVEVKSASADESQTLADVLNAALSSDEQVQESVQEEDAKTAGVRGGNGSSTRKQGVEVLKEKLLATVGKEAQS